MSPLEIVEFDYDMFASVLVHHGGGFDCASVVDGGAVGEASVGWSAIRYATVWWVGSIATVARVVVIGGGVASVEDGAHEVVGEAVAPTTFRSRTVGSIFSC